FHVAEFVVDGGHPGQEALEVEYAAPQFDVAGAIGDHVLEMEAPVAIAIALEVAHGVAAAQQHVADVELQPDDRRIGARDEGVVGHGAIDRLHVIRLVVERQPQPRAPGDGPGGVEAVGPFEPIVDRARRVRSETRHDEVLVAQDLRRLEAALPAHENDRGRHVRRRCAEPLVLQGGGDLRRGAAEVAHRPEQLDVGVPDGADRGQGALRIPRHRVSHGVQLAADALQLVARKPAEQAPRSSRARRADRAKERGAFHAIPLSRTRDAGGTAQPTYLDAWGGGVVHLAADAVDRSLGFTVRDSAADSAAVALPDNAAVACGAGQATVGATGGRRSLRYSLTVQGGQST